MHRWLPSSQPRRPATIPGVPDRTGRRCGLFGSPQAAAWILSDPRRRAASLLGVTTEPKRRQPTDHHENGA